MIDEIQVKNLALIREVTLTPGAGLTVLTGETGAGKTAVIQAIKLLLGGRASADAVRDGADSAQVTGRFFGADGQELIVRRSIGADGRSRASINGQMASMHELAEALGPQVDLCGQHDQQQLLKAASHITIFDAWAAGQSGVPFAEALGAYKRAYAEEQAARAEYARISQAATASGAKLDEARFVLKRIDEVGPEPGEYEELLETVSRAENSEALAQAAYGAHEALSGDNGATDALGAAISALDAGARYDATLGEFAQALREASFVLDDVASDVRKYRDSVEFDPETLQQLQERMSAFQGLLRAYGPRMEEVFAARNAAAETLELADDSGQRLAAAQKACAAAEAATNKAADALDAARNALIPQFAQAVTAQMQRMEMKGACFKVSNTRLERSQWGTKGPSALEFMFVPGEGMQPRPLARIASGGEISRALLAIKVVLGATDKTETLVFDEVDAGVGGTAALALAEVLADLAKTHQVVVVTHLAQVAVRAQVHALVQKQVGANGAPETTLRQLAREERPAEVARMLSGSVTATSLAHARELLARA